jgi:glucosyl-dolichyl phosphate glucuronosyltransferase
MQISLIICTNTEDRYDFLLEALASIERQTLLPDELILVVDHNEELLERLQPVVELMSAFSARVVENVYGLGLSGARNTGVDQASGDIVAFIDDDAVAKEDWLERLVSGYQDERVWGIGGRLVPWWLAPRPRWLVDEFYWVIGCSYRGMPNKTAVVRNFHGCNASFRMDLFDQVGKFSSALGRRGTFLAGAEETELCVRATASHPERSLLFSPDALVFHFVPPSRVRWSYFVSRCFSEGRSKAWMVRSTGVARGLSDEARYLGGLPRLIARLSWYAVRESDWSVLSGVAAVLVGAASTIAGFAIETTAVTVSDRNDDEPVYVPAPACGWDDSADVSVIVCSFSLERWPLLCRAIQSVLNQTLAPREIIVAVDHCPELVTRIHEAFPSVRTVENSGARGLSSARNTAIAASTGNIVAFLDDDAVASEDWLSRMCAIFVNPEVAGVGGHTSSDWSAPRPGWWPDEFDWVIGGSYRGMPVHRKFVRNVHGGNSAFRRSIFEVVGGFLPDVGRAAALPLGGEETELCIRTRRLIPTASFVHEPKARIVHHVPLARMNLRYFLSRCFAEGISKARIVRYEGLRAGLRTESSYLGHVLPRAVYRAAVAAIRRDGNLLGQAGASLLGVSVALGGFALELVAGSRKARNITPPPIFTREGE